MRTLRVLVCSVGQWLTGFLFFCCYDVMRPHIDAAIEVFSNYARLDLTKKVVVLYQSGRLVKALIVKLVTSLITSKTKFY